MKKLNSLIKASAALILAAFSFAIVTENSVFAQRTRPTSVERRVDHLNRQVLEDERDSLYRDLKGGKNKTGERITAQAKVEQVKKDFEVIQTGYNRIVVAMASKQDLDYDSILGTVAEVNKSAARLKDNLALPNAKNDEGSDVRRSEEELAQIEKSLLTLQKHIYSFVTNPLFEAPAVLDLEQAEKASRDLDKIIELSDNIRKNGDTLKKASNH